VQADKYGSESLEIDGGMSRLGKGVGRGVRYLRRVANLISWQLGSWECQINPLDLFSTRGGNWEMHTVENFAQDNQKKL
jgi:hypothetical protein